jgi:hypothetical protein
VSHDLIKVGDLVIFKNDDPSFRMGYVLWAGPDYEDASLDVKTIMRPGDIMIVVHVRQHNNIFLMLPDGTAGWSKATVLEKI